MHLKIPPAFQVLIGFLLIWLIKKWTNNVHFDFQFQEQLSWSVFSLAIVIGILALIPFFKARTTTDPTKPQAASALVTSGIYGFSRNPMYVAMLIILISIVIKSGNLYALFVPLLFVWSITQLQIKPEEKALKDIFGKVYLDYCQKVRRWI